AAHTAEQGRGAQRPAHQLSRLGRGQRPADRVRARLHVERPGVQRAGPALPGSVPTDRPRRPRSRRERVVTGWRVSVPRSGRRPGDARRCAGVRTLHPDRDVDGRDHRHGLCRRASGPAATPGPQRHRPRHRDRKPADHRDGGEPTGGVRDARRGDGIPPPGLAYHGRPEARGSARARAGCPSPATGRPLDLEDGPGLHPAARATRRAPAAGPVAGAQARAVSDAGGLGHGKRRAFGSASATHGGDAAQGPAGGCARRGPRTDSDGAGSAESPRAVPGIALTQNVYDNEEFFEGYSRLSRSVEGLDGAAEWPSLQALLPEMRGLRGVDLGCGFGWFCRWERGGGAAQVVGRDVSERMLARARATTEDSAITYTRADLEHLQLPEAPFALVYSS